MLVNRIHPYTGELRSKEIAITRTDLLMISKNGNHPVPCVNEEDKHFILTGMTKTEFDNYMEADTFPF